MPDLEKWFEVPHKTEDILREVAAERARQEAKFPEQHIADFPQRMDFEHAGRERDEVRDLTDRCAEAGVVTWWHVLREEVFEAWAERDETRLRAELIQVAAVAVRQIEDIDRRKLPVTDKEEGK